MNNNEDSSNSWKGHNFYDSRSCQCYRQLRNQNLTPSFALVKVNYFDGQKLRWHSCSLSDKPYAQQYMWRKLVGIIFSSFLQNVKRLFAMGGPALSLFCQQHTCGGHVPSPKHRVYRVKALVLLGLKGELAVRCLTIGKFSLRHTSMNFWSFARYLALSTCSCSTINMWFADIKFICWKKIFR